MSVPPIDIPAAVSNPALADEQSIMVNVGELRRMVRRAEDKRTAYDLYCVMLDEHNRQRTVLGMPPLRGKEAGEWLRGVLLRDAGRVADWFAQAQRPPIEDAIAAELESGA